MPMKNLSRLDPAFPPTRPVPTDATEAASRWSAGRPGPPPASLERDLRLPGGKAPPRPGRTGPRACSDPPGSLPRSGEKPPADTTRRRCENGRRFALRARAEAALPPGGGGRGPCAKAAALPRSPFAPWSVSSVMVPRPLDFLRKLKNASPSGLFSQRSGLIRTSSKSPGTFWNPLAEWKAQLAK